MQLITKANNISKSILNSYSQIFFSNKWGFALLLIVVTFFDFWAGVSGLLSVVFANSLAYTIGFSRHNIKCGYYGFNSLLVGLGLGVHFNPNFEFFVVLFFASMLTLFITLLLEGVIGKYGLPFLSLPFLICIWMVTLASRQFKSLSVTNSGIYGIEELYSYSGIKLTALYEWFYNLNIHESFIIYFKSLGAIFFQYNVIAGILIAIGILFYSRIAFLLSFIGFFSAYFYYQLIGANTSELSYSFIGFNFILTSIAIGGYFIVPSKYSFLWILLLTPLISIINTSSIAILSTWQLSILSLPFNIIVILFLYILKFRKTNFAFPEIVAVQQNTPEKNIYFQHNNKARFVGLLKFPFSLPFNGTWTVSQGHDGEFTHKDDWKNAFDFVITNSDNKTYKGFGNIKDNYLCYNKPIVAPADGWIEEIIDSVPDNEVGDVNVNDNWGNTIVIRHAPQLYSQISHILKGSVKVYKGAFVKKGEIIANCGNSGRSPEPHIHFQIQYTPFIGSKTASYPFSNYILNKNNSYELKSFEIPNKGEVISNIEQNTSLYNSFHFIPGQKLNFVVEINGEKTNVEWEVVTDIYNYSFIYCEKTNSKAYFSNDGNIHYFTSFDGKHDSLLFYFYLSAYKVLMGFYKGIIVKDSFPLNLLNKNILNIIQDFVAPFYIFMHSEYTMEYVFIENYLDSNSIILNSNTKVRALNYITKQYNFELHLSNNKIEKLIVKN